jgi:Protein of unknown function (DUF2933)
MLAATGIASILPVLIVLACPLMMVLMMRGMHGHSKARPREQMDIDELKRERDELNDEIGRRAERTT